MLFDELNCNISHQDIFQYPDAANTYEILSKHHNIDVKNIAVGFGVGELLPRIFQMLSNYSLGIHTPAYQIASIYAKANDIDFVESDDIDLLNTEVLYIANPNGVTGQALTREQILMLSKKYKFVIVDEVYADFSNIDCSVVNDCLELDNLIVVKSLSKSVAVPGLRFGYCFSNRKFIFDLQDTRPSHVTTGLTSSILEHVLSAKPAHIQRMLETKAHIEYHYDCVPSQGNYVLFKTLPPNLTKHIAIKQVGELSRMALTNLEIFKNAVNN
jgi:histidinol-phosphate aminotransferase